MTGHPMYILLRSVGYALFNLTFHKEFSFDLRHTCLSSTRTVLPTLTGGLCTCSRRVSATRWDCITARY